MSNAQKMPPARAIWMRYTNQDGKSHVVEHQVWDKDIFLATREDEAAGERARGNTKVKAEQITQEQYRSER